MFSKTALLGLPLLAAAVDAKATWQMTDVSLTSVGGVFATAADDCKAAMSDNDQGPGIYSTTDAGVSWTFNYGGALNTDIATDTKGNTVVSTIGAIFVSQNGGVLTPLSSRDITFSQNVETFGESSFGVTGEHYPDGVAGKYINGVAVSADGGSSWNYYDCGLDSGYTARYAAFPTADTWYVAGGSWSSASNSDSSPLGINRNQTHVEVNSRVTLHEGGRLSYASAPTASIYHGGIAKTTDGGATFQKVFDTKGQYYMNMIDCASPQVCMAVGQGNDDAYALRTEDGGRTWENVLTTTSPSGASLAAVKMLSEDEVWVSGGTFQKGMVGWYYHSVDGGKTWDQQTLEQAYSMDLSFAEGKGYSPAMKELGSSIAVYKE